MANKPHQVYHVTSVENPVDGRWRDRGWKEPIKSHNEGHPMGQPHVAHCAAVDRCHIDPSNPRGVTCDNTDDATISHHRAGERPGLSSDTFAEDVTPAEAAAAVGWR